jgi:hypothetical protein
MAVDLSRLVKPLEWGYAGVAQTDFNGMSFMAYCVEDAAPPFFVACGPSGQLGRKHPDLAAAQAAANADHAARVLASLNTAMIEELVGALDHEVKRSRRHLAASTLATLAKLKGTQDDR